MHSLVARQLIEFPHGNGIEVALGGGRINFMPNNTVDPEYPDYKGQRQDGRNLTEEWTKKAKGDGQWTYVWNDKEFKKLDANKVDHVLGKLQAYSSWILFLMKTILTEYE